VRLAVNIETVFLIFIFLLGLGVGGTVSFYLTAWWILHEVGKDRPNEKWERYLARIMKRAEK